MEVKKIKKSGFTMIEIIIVIVIAAILSAGTFIALKEIYLRSARSKAITELSSASTVASAQVASLLKDRVPSSVIGYDTNISNFKSIYEIDITYNVLEWIGTSAESFNHKDYSGFIDMDDSNKSANELYSPDTNISSIASSIKQKFDLSSNPFDSNLSAVVFAGSFDNGELVLSDEFNNSFGWHGNSADKVYAISSSSSGDRIVLKTHPQVIYEKYFLVDSAYALARGEDLNRSIMTNNCHFDTSFLDDKEYKNTLFLFYNYRPWNNETFCADPNTLHSESRDGNVTILAGEVKGFRANLLNGNLQFSITLQREISSDKKHSVTISKQRVIF